MPQETVFEDNQEIEFKVITNKINKWIEGENHQEAFNVVGLDISYGGQSFQMMVGGSDSFADLFESIKKEINEKLDNAFAVAIGN